MAVRPVDSLTMMPRLTEAGRVIQQQEQHPHAFQHVLGAQVAERAERGRTQVKQKANVEQASVQKDGKGPGGQGGQAQTQGGRRTPTPDAKPAKPASNGRLDVKV